MEHSRAHRTLIICGEGSACSLSHQDDQKKSPSLLKGFFIKTRRRPTLPLLSSTIGSPGLNYSVRNGKR